MTREAVAKSRVATVRLALVPSQTLSLASAAKFDNISNSLEAVSSSDNEDNKLIVLL